MTTETLHHHVHFSLRDDRLIDLISVVLISLATLMTAWCSYQSSSWGSLQAKRYAEANELRIKAASEEDAAHTRTAIDVSLFVQYLSARSAEHSQFADFLRAHFPDELKKATDEWEATHPETNPSAPSSPFTMPSFKVDAQERADRFNQIANEAFMNGLHANQHSDDYVLVTVLFASVSFLGGIGGKLRYPFHLVLLAFGALLLVLAFGMLTRLPATPIKPLIAEFKY